MSDGGDNQGMQPSSPAIPPPAARQASHAALITLEVEPGLRLSAQRSGPPGGPTLILSHGGGQTRHTWQRSAQVLAAAGFDCVALDLRGHGQSDWSPGGHYKIDDFERDLLALADLVSPHRPVAMVGFSLGGMASLQAAAHAPGRVESLVMVDVAPLLQVEGATRIRDFMLRHPDGFSSVDEAAAAVAAFRGAPTGASPGSLLRNLRQAPGGRLHWHWDPAVVTALSTPDIAEGLAASRSQLEQAAAQVRQPTLLVRGMESDVVSLDSASALRRLVPHLEFADVHGAGHTVVAERNDIFCDAILGFLSRRMAAARCGTSAA